jgi:tRNA pseudouridine55 synthase
MTGLLLIDKPSGPTSHDVVARIRKTARERSVGHTGTLDPRATGLLLLLCGKATRLSTLLMGHDKTYDARVALGVATDTDDADGEPIGKLDSARPSREELDAALAGFRGTFAQEPPAHSAKRVGGHRAYDLARADKAVPLAPVDVTVRALDCQAYDEETGAIDLRVTASSGFYVRALARDLGRVLGCGAHLATLRRTYVGDFDVTKAIPLDEAERLGEDIVQHLRSSREALPDLIEVTVTPVGLTRALHGNPLAPEHLMRHWLPPSSHTALVKVLDEAGAVVALARSRGGALHPSMVLADAPLPDARGYGGQAPPARNRR